MKSKRLNMMAFNFKIIDIDNNTETIQIRYISLHQPERNRAKATKQDSS